MPFSLQHKCLFVHIPRNGGTSFRVALGIKSPTRDTPSQELNGDFKIQPKDETKIPLSLQLHHLCMKHIQILGVFNHSLLDESFKCAFVRNPWDKALSEYSHYYYQHSIDFEDYINRLEKIVSFINENFVFDFSDVFYEKYSNLMISTLNEVNHKWILNPEAIDARTWVDPHFFPQHLFIYDEFDNQLIDSIGRFENYETDAQNILNSLGVVGAIPHSNSSTHKNYRDVYSLKTRDIVYNLFKKDIQTFDYTF